MMSETTSTNTGDTEHRQQREPSPRAALTLKTGDGESSETSTTVSIPEHVFAVPQRCVKFPDDMVAWEKSSAYHHLFIFINSVSQSIQGRRCSDQLPQSARVDRILEIFDKFDVLVSDTPPIDQPQRFGNQAFRDCFAKLKANALAYLQAALPDNLQRAAVEISVYLVESFGNAIRIDYGTGHELCFVMFLCCLYKVNALDEEDKAATALKIFDRYLRFVRSLQKIYRMEPAGSHGVWSLDDYQFIPFIWGSAQFAVNAPIRPPQFLETNVIEKHKDDYMFIGCIDYINQVKTGNFAEHSPQLWNISAVESWVKINSGLVKMYQKEILAKFPVIQHVLFGSLMEFKPMPPGSVLSMPRLAMMPPISTTPRQSAFSRKPSEMPPSP